MEAGTYAFAQLLKVLPRARITRAVGTLCELPLPEPVARAVVGVYAGAYDVALDEAVLPDGSPAGTGSTYPTFDAFFTRRLREGARPLADGPFVCPSDGRLDAAGPVDLEGAIEVKGRPYRAADLLCSEAAAQRYKGGQFAVIYLSPRDYHRVHSPVAGRIVEVRSRRGELFPVNSISEKHVPQFLARNRRVAIDIDSDECGRITVVMVAAMVVGRVTVTGIEARDVPYGTHVPTTPTELARGDELAIFHLGSTAVLFAEEGRVPSWDRPYGPVRLGQRMSMLDGANGAERQRGSA